MFFLKAFLKEHLKSLFPPAFLYFLLIWTLMNILQGIFTEITEDEAYYWMYAQYPDWGYFDHPPMISLFIKIGSTLFKGELGVRLITILAQTTCICLIWWIIDEASRETKKIQTFFVITASVVMLQVYGFIATPDSPLLLFTALFLAAYKLFLEQKSIWAVGLLVIAMTGLLYSKYHGVLVIFFVLLSNPKILLSYRFWLAGLITILLFTPHMIWQFQYDFPSFQFHLVSRADDFQIKNVLNYIPNQLVSFNPFFLILFLFLFVKNKAADLFERGLYFVSIGFLLFFFLSAFRGHVEPHWTIAASIPMIITIYRKGIHHKASLKYINYVLLPTVGLLMVVRLALAIGLLPAELGFDGKKEYNERLDEIAGDRPVVFESTYQEPSLYTFYSGKKATAINGLSYRKSQFNIWSIEDSFLMKNVVVVTNRWENKGQPYAFPNEKTVFLLEVDSFFTTQRVEISTDQELRELKTGDHISLQASVYNPYPKGIPFKDPVSPVSFLAYFSQNGKELAAVPMSTAQDLNLLNAGQRIPIDLQFEVPVLPPGKYNFGITLKAGSFPKTFNNDFQTIEVIQ